MSKELKPLADRTLEMFTDWMDGMTQQEIADKFEMSLDNVKKISSRTRWAEHRLIIERSRYELAKDNLKGRFVRVMQAVDADFERMMADVEKEGRQLTAAERDYMRQLAMMYQKEIRIDDDGLSGEENLPASIRGTIKFSAPVDNLAAFAMFNKPGDVDVISDVEYEEVKKSAGVEGKKKKPEPTE